MCFCAYMCVFSALIYQHACPLIMKVMIYQQMTYSRKKTQHNLLFTATLSSVIFDSFWRWIHYFFLQNVTTSLQKRIISHSFSLHIFFFLDMLHLFWPYAVMWGETEGLSLFDLGCPALLPPALGPTGGLWRHLGPLGGYYKAPVWPSPLRQRG